MIKFLQERMKKGRSEEGFTLIELLMVIIILAILAAVVIFSIQGINDRGQDSACRTDERTLRTAQEANFAENGVYTTEPLLVTNGFLDEESTLHDFTAGSSATAYDVGACTP